MRTGVWVVYTINVIAFLGQLGSALALAILAATGTLSLSIELSESYLFYDDDGFVFKENFSLFAINPTWLLVVMCSITASKHALVLIPRIFRIYYRFGERAFNLFSWIEYSVTASIMTFVLLLLTGVTEPSKAIPIASMLGFTNLLGGLVPEFLDYFTHQSLPKFAVIWIPFVITACLSLGPWIPITTAVIISVSQSSAGLPIWLWLAFAGTFVNFNVFGIIFLVQHLEPAFVRKNPWLPTAFFDSSSLFSKLWLTWFFAGGILSRS